METNLDTFDSDDEADATARKARRLGEAASASAFPEVADGKESGNEEIPEANQGNHSRLMQCDGWICPAAATLADGCSIIKAVLMY